MPNINLPRPQSEVQGRGSVSPEWYEFFRTLRDLVVASGIDPGVIADILARLDALEAAGATSFQILGPLSVQAFGTPESGTVVLQLQNDSSAPGALYYYRTDATGAKGWGTIKPDELPISLIGVYPQDEDGNWLVDEAGAVLMTDDLHQMAADPDSPIGNVQRAFDVMTSPGIITGGAVTALTSTSVRITGGTALLRVADDNTSELRFFRFASQDFSVPDVQVTHFYALDYNGGSPVIVESTVTENWNRDTQIPLGSALRGNGLLNVTPNPYRTGDVVTNLIQRLDAVGPVQRDNSVGGLALGETGTRNVTVSAGRLWARVSDFTVLSKNSATDTMATVYFNGTNLTVTSGIAQWDNLHFNNLGAGTLQVMGNNKYANLWFFMSFDGTKYGFAYGTNEYNTLGDAANEGIPSYLTQNFFNQFLLLGRFIFQKGAATPSLIDSAFAGQTFTGTAINDHNLLGGLQGGAVGEYYHLTAAQQADVATLSAGGTTAQFWRGDQAYSDTLTGGLNFTLDAPAQMFINAFRYGNDAVPPQLAFNKARGTSSVPAAVQAADQLLEFQARGYTSAGAFSGNVGGFRIVAIDNFTSTTQGTRFILRCANTGSTTVATVLESDASRNILPGADATQTLGSSAQRWSNIHAGGAVLQTGAVSPAQLTANTDNWAVTGITTAAIIRASTDASRNLTGIATPTAGQVVILVNVGTQDLVLVHDATSTAANRFLLPNSANLTLNPNDSVSLWYDNTSSRWRALGV